ncbi:MAG: Gfo/Idh/MocA family protein [Microthrixaceae bacterium]
MVDIGFLGCGFIARYHAMQLALSPHHATVVACHDADRSRAEGFSRELGKQMGAPGTPVVCETAEEVVERSSAVFVCTWTASHLESVGVASARDVPVFCEKPLRVDLAQARRVAGLLDELPVHAVGLVLRTSPAMHVVRELLREESVGAVMNVVFRDDQYLPVGGIYGSDWRADRVRAGSGTLLEHSIHDADLLDWLVGPIESVSATQGFFHGLDGIEDNVAAMGTLRSGGTFSLASVWHQIHDRPSQRRVEVFCERALICLEGDVSGPVSKTSDEQSLVLDGDQLTEWLAGRGVEVTSTESDFLAAVGDLAAGRQPTPVIPGATQALRAHEIVDAMYESAASEGRRVTLEPSR